MSSSQDRSLPGLPANKSGSVSRPSAGGRPSLAHRTILACSLLLAATPAAAQWNGWERDRQPFPHVSRVDAIRGGRDMPSREVDVSTFVADGALADMLGRGSIEVLPAVGDEGGSAAFEAAVVDRLVAAGYDTAAPPGRSGQVTELRIVRRELSSEARPHKPVSGEMAVGIGNRGSSAGLALAIDLSKAPGPLVATRLEAPIRDRVSDELLWEGRAEVVTREDDAGSSGERVASRLAGALFADFPGRS